MYQKLALNPTLWANWTRLFGACNSLWPWMPSAAAGPTRVTWATNSGNESSRKQKTSLRCPSLVKDNQTVPPFWGCALVGSQISRREEIFVLEIETIKETGHKMTISQWEWLAWPCIFSQAGSTYLWRERESGKKNVLWKRLPSYARLKMSRN